MEIPSVIKQEVVEIPEAIPAAEIPIVIKKEIPEFPMTEIFMDIQPEIPVTIPIAVKKEILEIPKEIQEKILEIPDLKMEFQETPLEIPAEICPDYNMETTEVSGNSSVEFPQIPEEDLLRPLAKAPRRCTRRLGKDNLPVDRQRPLSPAEKTAKKRKSPELPVEPTKKSARIQQRKVYNYGFC